MNETDIYADIGYENGVSSCCGAKVYRDREVCEACGEHCSVEKVEEDDSKIIPLGK